MLDIKGVIRARVEEGKLILEPLKELIEMSTSSVRRGEGVPEPQEESRKGDFEEVGREMALIERTS